MKDSSLREEKARILKALAHPTRLLFVESLANGELCVCELNALIDADVSTVSKHLSVLKNAGIVSCEKRGLQVYYNLKVPCVLNFMGCIQGVLENGLRERRDLLK